MSDIRSLCNKLEELQLLEGKNFPSSSVLCFTDMVVWINTRPRLQLAGFQLFRTDRNTELSGKTKGVGICSYINDSWCNDTTMIL